MQVNLAKFCHHSDGNNEGSNLNYLPPHANDELVFVDPTDMSWNNLIISSFLTFLPSTPFGEWINSPCTDSMKILR
jgi:hypothetical protein